MIICTGCGNRIVDDKENEVYIISCNKCRKGGDRDDT